MKKRRCGQAKGARAKENQYAIARRLSLLLIAVAIRAAQIGFEIVVLCVTGFNVVVLDFFG